MAFHLREGGYDTEQLIPIVAALGRLLGGDAPVILVSPTPTSKPRSTRQG